MNCKIFKKITVPILAFFLLSLIAYGQNETNNEWLSLNRDHSNGKIDDTTYFNKAQLIVEQSFKIFTLKESLNYFKELAWSKKKYTPYRIKYYAYLANNAAYTHKDGAAIYYLEKLESELKSNQLYINSLNQTRILLALYLETKGDTKRRDVIEKILPFLDSLPKLIIKDSVPEVTCLNAMTILLNASKFYGDKSDEHNVKKILSIAERLYSSILQKKILSEAKEQQVAFQLLQIKYVDYKVDKNPGLQKNVLDSSYRIINSSVKTKMNNLWRRVSLKNLFLKYVDFYTEQKKFDSADHYLNILDTIMASKTEASGDEPLYLLSYSKTKAAEGEYKIAFNKLLEAYNINDSIISLKMLDINNNLYAFTQQEDTRAELIKTETQKNRRNIFIVFLAFVFLLSLGTFLYIIKRKNEATKERINNLNIASAIQIAELEEKTLTAKQDEQKRLGMELHDDLTGDIASLKIKLETQIFNIPDDALGLKLKELSKNVSHLYEKARNKSHSWYNHENFETERAFETRIHSILDNALPDKNFIKEIIIEENSMKNVTLKTKIEILYIIQEAITNILKHAKAQKISIIIYQDVHLILQIIDDGIGFRHNKKEGLGLQSIKNRVHAVNGKLEIISGIHEGTNINISIP